MKTNNKAIKLFLSAFILMAAISCKKDNSLEDAFNLNALQAEIANAQAIAIAPIAGTNDSIYIINTCQRGQKRDSIAFSSLPSSVSTYLSTSYTGYTFQKAFSIKDMNGNANGYVVVIQYNSKPVGLKFDASGNFTKVLEQREGRDIRGPGFHHGGRFDDRDGQRRDTIALNDLSSGIKSYLAANYSADTLRRAFKGKDSSIVVISVNNGVFATVFHTNGTFIKRVQLPARPGRPDAIELGALPANAQSYLTATYPNNVFKHAFKIERNGAVQGYVVLIDANATKYAVEFDASGNFVKAVTVR
jgi:hypothetical protein